MAGEPLPVVEVVDALEAPPGEQAVGRHAQQGRDTPGRPVASARRSAGSADTAARMPSRADAGARRPSPARRGSRAGRRRPAGRRARRPPAARRARSGRRCAGEVRGRTPAGPGDRRGAQEHPPGPRLGGQGAEEVGQQTACPRVATSSGDSGRSSAPGSPGRSSLPENRVTKELQAVAVVIGEPDVRRGGHRVAPGRERARRIGEPAVELGVDLAEHAEASRRSSRAARAGRAPRCGRCGPRLLAPLPPSRQPRW